MWRSACYCVITLDQAATVDGIRQFLKLHATCGPAFLDAPEVPGGYGYRVVAACYCGDTVEYWVTEAFLSLDHLVAAPPPTKVA